MNDRKSAIRYISRRLGSRDLIWGGLRADDIEAISDLPQLAQSFSIIGGHERGGAVPSLEFEDLAGSREDLDAWDIDEHLDTPEAHEFRVALLNRLAKPTALLPYRPSRFLSAVVFARRDRCLDLGLFGGHQGLFEHKPWVETQVSGLGLPCVEWTYVADEERMHVERMLADGPVMLRLSRSSGGAGLVKLDSPLRLAEAWPHSPEAFVGVSRYLADALPVNIGATVWHDGVTMRHASVQMIGIAGCTNRPFGYCGNDFGLAAELDGSTLDSIEESVLALGRWLGGFNYRGAFGVDFLVHNGVPLFMEINPRFQGSTHASSQLSGEAGESCVILDHLVAMLGHDAPCQHRLRETARNAPALAHLAIHWTRPTAVVSAASLRDAVRGHPAHSRTDVCAKPTVETRTGGMVARIVVRDRMTTSGFDLSEPWATLVRDWLDRASAAPDFGSRDGTPCDSA